jgi:tRNA (guanine26-N2/guanine27-N2)-dimethyltransferase
MNEASEVVKEIICNDANPKAVEYAKQNFSGRIENTDANVFLHSNGAFDYIDIDPFGSPNPFLDAACQNLALKGILALTATDTAALAGSAVQACKRKYWARPLNNEFKHETGIRILIRKAQLAASQYEKSLEPIYCHLGTHYARLFLREEGTLKDVFKQQGYIHYCFRCLKREIKQANTPEHCCNAPMSVAGPLWTGRLWDEKLAKDVAAHAKETDDSIVKLTQTIAEESVIEAVGTYSLPKLASKHKLAVPKMNFLLSKINGARTHFAKQSVRTKDSVETLLNAIKSPQKV